MEKIKLLPYGISDFKQIQREGKYIVDKTMYISKMEKTAQFNFSVDDTDDGLSEDLAHTIHEEGYV